MAIIKDSQKSLNGYLASSIYDGDLQSAKEYIKEGANVNHNGGELLIQNIMKNKTEAVRFLIDNKASFKTTHQKLTPITTALKFADKTMVELLVEKGANVQENNNTPIKYAANRRDFEMVKYLHQKGASLNDKYDHIIRDLSEHSLEAFKYCLDNSSEIQNKDTLINHVVEHGKTDCLDYLIDKGIPMNGVDKNGDYPLCMASIAGHADKIEMLIANGVEPNDQKALLGAVNNGHLDAVKALVNHGADPTKNNDNALYQATVKGKQSIVNFLLVEHKMPVNSETRKWLEEQRGINKDVANTFNVLTKRDLNERLTEKSERMPPRTQVKKQNLKL